MYNHRPYNLSLKYSFLRRVERLPTGLFITWMELKLSKNCNLVSILHMIALENQELVSFTEFALTVIAHKKESAARS